MRRGVTLLLVLALAGCASSPPIKVTCIRNPTTPFEAPDTVQMLGSWALRHLPCPNEYRLVDTEHVIEPSMWEIVVGGAVIAGAAWWFTVLSWSTDEPDE